MAGTAKKWLIGCGLGCGFFVALGLGLGAAGWYGVRHVAKRAESIEAVSDSLATRFGPPEEYVPPVDGHLASARLEAFLEARRLMAPVRERTSRSLAVLDGSSGSNVPARIVAGVNFVPQLLTFVAERDRALLTVGMGTGEYQYLYTMAYFGLLKKDPGDGPGFQLSQGNGGEGHGGADWSFSTRHGGGHGSGNSDGAGDGAGDKAARETKRETERETARRDRADVVREDLNRVQRENLRRQLAALDAEGATAGKGRAAWRDDLAAELTAMDNERRRFAWEQGLPEAMRGSLEPFRDRFEASYDAMTGVLELRLNDRD
jgi:hypothetical protein